MEDQPVSSDDKTTPSPVVDLEKYELGESVFVETADALILESFPLQVNVKIIGNLPDACTTIYQTESERDGNTFRIKILTLREKEVMCAQVLTPFEVSVPLDVMGLPAGAYRVSVNDLNAEFTFTQDNIIQNAEESN
jgi:inhibitor of cysteine peptidase